MSLSKDDKVNPWIILGLFQCLLGLLEVYGFGVGFGVGVAGGGGVNSQAGVFVFPIWFRGYPLRHTSEVQFHEARGPIRGGTPVWQLLQARF